jgi:hypothetical protein
VKTRMPVRQREGGIQGQANLLQNTCTCGQIINGLWHIYCAIIIVHKYRFLQDMLSGNTTSFVSKITRARKHAYRLARRDHILHASSEIIYMFTSTFFCMPIRSPHMSGVQMLGMYSLFDLIGGLQCLPLRQIGSDSDDCLAISINTPITVVCCQIHVSQDMTSFSEHIICIRS